jgi:hypothetical protein
VYNAMIDRRPRVIVRCAGVDDVVAAVNFARDGGLGIAVRGGSHSVPGFGTADDAVVIDLVRMQGVEVNPARRTARAQGGPTWGPSTTPPTRTAWPRRAGSSPRPASAGSRSAAGSATSPAGTGSPATTCAQPRS